MVSVAFRAWAAPPTLHHYRQKMSLLYVVETIGIWTGFSVLPGLGKDPAGGTENPDWIKALLG